MKPFLKWAGNKYRIINHIREKLPSGERLIEPFAGASAVFLNTEYASYLIADNNPDIINLYRHLQREGILFIRYCSTLFTPENNVQERYLTYREEFNATGNRRRRAALFLYMNRHGFNGLCRYNSSGVFNVPFGKYRKPYFPEKEMCYFAEKSRNAVFLCADFATTMKKARPGDVVYCDPPYVPLSATANFTAYSAGGFSEEQQVHLGSAALHLAARGIPVLISNNATPPVLALYRKAVCTIIPVRRSISCDGGSRGSVNEVLALFQQESAGL